MDRNVFSDDVTAGCELREGTAHGGGLLFVRWDDLDTWPCVSDGGGRMEGEEEGKRKERGVEEKGERSGRERREEGNISLSTAGLCVR